MRRTPFRLSLFPLALASITTACAPVGVESNQGLFVYQGDEALIDDPAPLSRPGSPLSYLGGTVVCPTIEPAAQEVDTVFFSTRVPGEGFREDCFREEGIGAGSLDGDGAGACAALGQAGTFVWEFDARSCDFTDTFRVADDSYALTAVPLDDLAPLLVGWAELLAEAFLAPHPEDEWPPDTQPLPGGDVGLWAGTPFGFRLGLIGGSSGYQLIAYRLGDVLAPGQTGLSGQLDVRLDVLEGPGGSVTTGGGRVTLTLEEGTVAELIAVSGETEAVVARVHAVGPEEVGDLTIQAAWDDMQGFPAFARAIVRSVDGHLVYGAPVGWFASGELRVRDGEVFLGEWPDYAEFTRVIPEEERVAPYEVEAYLAAALAGHLATKDVSWEVRARPPRENEPPAPVGNRSGCSVPGGPSPSGWLSLLPWFLLRARSRRASARPA